MTRRILLAAALLSVSAFAAPTLTTIQDVLYKADGTRFNGALTINWTGFQAADNTTVVTHSSTVKVVDGNLRVQLVPTTSSTPSAYYSVTYQSDGRVQFQETWSVPSTGQILRLRDVRVITAEQTSPDTGNQETPIQQSDVVGLIADLSARPVKGAGYAAGRLVMVNATGALETVVGSAGDCVRVDGSSGPCGGEAPSFIDGDSPTGIVDGANAFFNLAAVPKPVSSLSIYRNGLLQKAGQDFTMTGTSIRFVSEAVPQPGDTLLASYRVLEAAEETSTVFSSAQVLCSGAGASTTSTEMSSVGTCSIPAGVLHTGDRVEIRFDYAHQGTASGFSIKVLWGAATVVERSVDATETLVTGRAEAGILADGAQLSSQSWGTALAFQAGIAGSTDSYTAGLTLSFQGRLAGTGDSLALKNFTVVRYP